MFVLQLTKLSNAEKSLNGSVFPDLGVMVLMRVIGSGIFAILLIIFIVFPIYTKIWKFFTLKYPYLGPNLYLRKHRYKMQDRKDYKEYLEWTSRHGYKPEFEEGRFLQK